MGYVKAAGIDMVPAGTMKKFSIDQHVILLANVDGVIYALDNKCPHMGGDLSEGNLEGKLVSCPKHGAKFDVTSGKTVQSAKIAFISMKVGDAKTFPVKVEDNDILVELP